MATRTRPTPRWRRCAIASAACAGFGFILVLNGSIRSPRHSADGPDAFSPRGEFKIRSSRSDPGRRVHGGLDIAQGFGHASRNAAEEANAHDDIRRASVAAGTPRSASTQARPPSAAGSGGGQVVGGAWRERAIADQSVQPLNAIDRNAQMGGLTGSPAASLKASAWPTLGIGRQRMQRHGARLGDTLHQVLRRSMIRKPTVGFIP